MSDREQYCKVFVDAACSRDELVQLCRDVLGGRPAGRGLTAGTWELDVLTNPDRTAGSEDFLFWPLLIEVVAEDEAVLVGSVSRLLSALWGSGIRAGRL